MVLAKSSRLSVWWRKGRIDMKMVESLAMLGVKIWLRIFSKQNFYISSLCTIDLHRRNICLKICSHKIHNSCHPWHPDYQPIKCQDWKIKSANYVRWCTQVNCHKETRLRSVVSNSIAMFALFWQTEKQVQRILKNGNKY